MTSTKLVTFHVPKDQALLAAFGKMALCHEHMNYSLKMTIKTLAAIPLADALKQTEYRGSSYLREQVKKHARKALGEGAALRKLQGLMDTCAALAEKRNNLVHSFWANELDGRARISDARGNERPLPTVAELRALAKEIENHTKHLNWERREGFLAKALQRNGYLQ